MPTWDYECRICKSAVTIVLSPEADEKLTGRPFKCVECGSTKVNVTGYDKWDETSHADLVSKVFAIEEKLKDLEKMLYEFTEAEGH